MSAKKTEEQVNPSLDIPSLDLSGLAPRPRSRKVRKRLGIGEGSGNGKTSGKGQKGQTSRSGFGLRAGFEGGQMPIYRRLPKVGFTSRKRVTGVNLFQVLGVDDLQNAIDSGIKGDLTLEALKQSGLVRANRRLKILGGKVAQEVKSKIVVEAHAVSAAAKAAIEKAGGQVRLIEE